MDNEFSRSGLPPYDEGQEGKPEELEWDVHEPEEPAAYARLRRPPLRRGRRRLGRTVTVRGMVGLLLLLLLAIAVWWVARTIFLPPQATPTPAAVATPESVSSPTPVATVAETVGVVTPLPSPTPTVLVPKIAVGQVVRVSGTGKEGIRFRTGAGLDYVTLEILEEGTKLKVLAGPEGADGHVWWRLEMEDGTIGWAVEDWLQPVAGID